MKIEATKSGDEFVEALVAQAPQFDVALTGEAVAKLRGYYEHVRDWNPRLHLVAPCSPEEFATRHVLESLFATHFLSPAARVIDVGSGAGFPAIPCLIVRQDLQVTLIESSPKKTIFLREALRRSSCAARGIIVAERFEKMLAPPSDFVTCRALDRFHELFPTLVSWSPPASTLLFFGGATLGQQIEDAALNYQSVLIPESERRFIFIIKRAPL